jgi:predicted  nucleic acid-binding Zn-ribbon protein
MSYNSDIDKLNRVTDTLSSVIRNLKTFKQETPDITSEMSRCKNEIDSSKSALDEVIRETGNAADYLNDLEYAIDELEKKLKGED